jgi:6-phosphogluconolactonase (cycloisomerase 2 family)
MRTEEIRYAYIGSRTTEKRKARGEGISVFRIDPANGVLTLVQQVGGLVNPSVLCIDKSGDHLYSAHGDESEVSAFRIDRESGKLDFINRENCGGTNPVDLALDPSGRFLVVSNHITSSVAVLPVGADGHVGPVRQLEQLSGPLGPHRIEQPFAKPHANPFDAQGRFVYVPDKGLDRVFIYRFIDGRLEPADPPFVATREGAGPRHLAFHPDKPFAYVVNELDSTVTAYRVISESGALEPFQVLPSVPDTYTGNNRASEIFVAPDGRHLYASNRGHDSIAVFELDGHSGRMRLVDVTATCGRTPRFFAIALGGRWLYALNEDSDSIIVFAIEAQSGRLTPSGLAIKCGSPVWMTFSR